MRVPLGSVLMDGRVLSQMAANPLDPLMESRWAGVSLNNAHIAWQPSMRPLISGKWAADVFNRITRVGLCQPQPVISHQQVTKTTAVREQCRASDHDTIVHQQLSCSRPVIAACWQQPVAHLHKGL